MNQTYLGLVYSRDSIRCGRECNDGMEGIGGSTMQSGKDFINLESEFGD